MRIKWLGHSCFLLTSASGIRILTDPFDEKVGYPVPSVEADIVTTSHQHYDHNYIQAVKGEFAHFSNPGEYEAKGICIKGVATYHDMEEGAKRGSNTVFVFQIDGLRICHLGDLGHVLTDEQIEAVGEVDLLLIPIGGTYTIDHREATEVVALMNPKLVIPMHYKTPVMDFPIEGLENFLASIGSAESAGRQEIELSPETVNRSAKVVVLDYE